MFESCHPHYRNRWRERRFAKFVNFFVKIYFVNAVMWESENVALW